MMTETAKYRHLTQPYCVGNGIDIGSGGDPVVPTAIQIELPMAVYLHYNSGQKPRSPIQWMGNVIKDLPFKDGVLDYVYSSHLIEDFLDWSPLLREWSRVLKVGGHLIILLPDKERWNRAIQNGQPPNCAHQHESFAGELSQQVRRLGLVYEILEDRLTNLNPADYNILFVARKR